MYFVSELPQLKNWRMLNWVAKNAYAKNSIHPIIVSLSDVRIKQSVNVRGVSGIQSRVPTNTYSYLNELKVE